MKNRGRPKQRWMEDIDKDLGRTWIRLPIDRKSTASKPGGVYPKVDVIIAENGEDDDYRERRYSFL